MANFIILLALFGSLALVSAELNCATAEWTGKPWLGRWKSTDRQENMAAFFEAMGWGAPQTTFHEYWKVGDDYFHQIRIPAGNFSQEFQFKLPEGANVKAIKYVKAVPGGSVRAWAYQEKDGKLVSDITLNGKTVHNEGEVQMLGDEFVDTKKINDISAKRWYSRVPHTCMPKHIQ